MSEAYLFDRIVELKNKLKNFFSHKKKSQALENYSMVTHFPHKDYLTLIKKCMSSGFLGEKEADFLDYMLEKYDVAYLDWAHRTKWLKGQMAQMAAEYQKTIPVQPFLFDFDKKRPQMASNIPFELLVQQQKSQTEQRV